MKIQESEIISYYKKSGKVFDTWNKYKKFFSRYQIRDILFRADVLNKRGGAFNVAEFVEDKSRDFKFLTDKDLNFEDEIKSKLY